MADIEGARRSSSDVARDRAAMHDLWPGILALVVAQGSLLVFDPDGSDALTIIWSLLPLFPAAWLVWAQLRCLGRADEYQRTLQLESMAIGFAAVLLLSLTGGLLDAADVGSPSQFLQLTFIGGVLVWVAALVLKTRPAR